MNGNRLKAIIIERKRRIGDVAKDLNLSKSAFYRKMYGMSEFTREEIKKIVAVLGLSESDMVDVFFAD